MHSPKQFMSLNLIRDILKIAFLAFTMSATADIETECADHILTAKHVEDLPVANVDSPYGFWRLEHHEVRVEKDILLHILDVRGRRIERAGLVPHGTYFLREQINALGADQWPVDMQTLTPPASAKAGVKKPKHDSESYLKSRFYQLAMQEIEHWLILDNALLFGYAETREIDGSRINHIQHYTFNERIEKMFVSGRVWMDPKGVKIHDKCNLFPMGGSD